MNDIEEKLWKYIDGDCSPEEQTVIAVLIAQDEVYRQKYNELLKLNSDFLAMELDEPPMAFTYNVMETIRNEHAMQPLKSAIDKRIIRGIGLFFILAISAIVIFALASVNWSAGNVAAQAPRISLPDMKNVFTGPVMQGFLFFDTVLVLYLLDTYLRKRSLSKTNTGVQTSIQQDK